MNWFSIPDRSSEIGEVIHEGGKKLIYTIGGLYLLAHIIATLGFPDLFSPQIWLLSIYMFALVLGCVYLIERSYLVSQILWLLGLMGAVLLAVWLFSFPLALFLLAFLPLLAAVSLGYGGAIIAVLLITLVAFGLSWFQVFPVTYGWGIFLAGSAMTLFGWGLLSSLLGALDAASYHYREARRFLAETQKHRAQISQMLKEQERINYQLERMNEMLAFARAQAEQAHENRNRFMLAVSHELRTPLNFIIGFSDVMVNAPETYAPLEKWPPGLYEDVQEIYNSSKHLMRLINDILDMGKINADQMTLYREQTQIQNLIEDVRTMVAGAFEAKGLEFIVQVAPDLPPVFIDATRIRQVLINLLNNALRFTDRGSVTVRVSDAQSHLVIEVIDTGTGIAPEDLPKVFDEFRQVGEENWRRRSGSGLGLYISRRFVELHGGRMGVESTLGQGTRFYFTIPYETTTLGKEFFSPLPPAPVPPPPVLLLTRYPEEDVEFLKPFLDGYTIETITDAGDLPHTVRSIFPRAVLVAPEFSFLDIHSLPYDLPLIRLPLPRPVSAFPNVRAYLVKPITRQVLLETVRALQPSPGELLVVDDDAAMLRFVQQSLRSEGREDRLLTAATGQEALEILRHHSVHLVLLDLGLPDISGWEWLQRLQAEEHLAHVPVVVVSAQDTPYVSMENTLLLTLQRPFAKSELEALLKAALRHVLPEYPQAS